MRTLSAVGLALLLVGWAGPGRLERSGIAVPVVAFDAELSADTVFWRLRLAPSLDLDAPAPEAARAPLGLGSVPLPFPIVFRRVAGLDLTRSPLPGLAYEEAWKERLAGSVATPREVLARLSMGRVLDAAPGALLPPSAEPPSVSDSTALPIALPGFITESADLRMRLTGRTELGGDWTRFRPCDAGQQFTCNPSLFPQISPDVQFGLQIQGTIRDRFHVDVDYDQTREFSAANNINLYYQGLEDEIIQRVEMGDVGFRLPPSRFLTEGIPAGNFGFRTTGVLGPIDFQAVWAQQKGDKSSTDFQLAGVGSNQGYVQEDTLVLDDADYVDGQFFFILDPRDIAGYPALDVLSLTPADAPADQSPGSLPIQLYRFENDPVTTQQVQGYLQADAIAEMDGDTLVESGWFRFLESGVDYYVHPSGLWVGLRRPLRSDEMLAVTYITATGDTIGQYDPERIHNVGGRPQLRLLRAGGPNHQPGRPTWDREMHQIYRVSGSSDVEIPSVHLQVSVGELSGGRTFTRQLTGEDITFLKLFGLDEESPTDQLDLSFVYKPASESVQDQPPVSGTFIVFPTLRPFETPPPVPSLGLSGSQTQQILGADANQQIYNDPDPFERQNGGLFRLTIPFRVRSEGLVSSFSLGALGIRDGSEKIYLGDRELRAQEDYLIDYDIGQVTLLDAQGLFAGSPGAGIRASWEQQSIFNIAPTSVFGFNARYDLGERGEFNVLGLFQSEKTLSRRPQLGVEPSAIMLGGVNGDLNFGVRWIDRALSHVPGLNLSGESSLRVNGEVAVSLPDPNTRGDVFLDDFDATSDLQLPRTSSGWRLGSAPEFRDGAEVELPGALGESDAANLVWQHSWIVSGGGADSLGIFEGFLPRQDIDRQIQVSGGTQLRETGLLIHFGDGQGDRFDRPRWRSMTTALSTTGLDLTKSEFIEFYVAGGDSLVLIMDLGSVSEDAMFVDGQGRTDGIKENGQAWGLGRLDQEADPRRGEIWSRDFDEFGVWGEGCLATPATVFPLADPRANCTRGNGRPDTEDLDGDGNLDTGDRALRYVIKLDGSSPFLARSSDDTGTQFRLYRIPLRGAHVENPGGLFTDADLRGVKNLRLTFAGPTRSLLVLARMRIVGSRWVKRAQDGIVRGLVGDTVGLSGLLEISPVSRLTEGDDYQPPVGVLQQLDDPTSALSGQGVEFAERSLGLEFTTLGPGDRAEIFNRFPQRPRNLLTYRQARIWAVARSGDWGESGPLRFFVKMGTDPENFYLYRTPLPEPGNGGVTPNDWLPEIVIDFDEWLDLRREAEEFMILNPPVPGDPPLTFWNADSTYAVVLEDRSRAPVLAAIRELSLGVVNAGDLPADGEVWIDEFRLSAAFRDPGVAGFVNVDLQAGDLLSTRVSVSDQGPFYRQLEGDPNYQSSKLTTVSSTLQLGRFTPAGWGLDLPLTVSHTRTAIDPFFLNRSDIRADRLAGLRASGSQQTRYGLAFRKRTPTANPWLGWLLDGVDARVGYAKSESSTVTSENSGESFDARLAYGRQLEPRDLPIVPGFLGGVIRAVLPESLEERVLNSRLRWSPQRVGFGTSYFDQENQASRFDQILELPSDALVVPTFSPRTGVESSADIAFAPLGSLTAEVNLLTTRDLLSPDLAVRDPGVRPLLQDERLHLGGLDLGWETNRSVRTRLGLRPRLGNWFSSTLNYTTTYGSDRNASYIERTVLGTDTARALQRNVNGQRNVQATAVVEPEDLARSLLGDIGEGGAVTQAVRGLTSAVAPLRVAWTSGLTSRFNREVVQPDAAFQLGLGGVDEFRFLGSDTAAILTDRDSWTLGSGLSLGRSLNFAVDYREASSTTLDTRSGRSSLDRTWPSVQASWTDVPLPALIRPLIQRLTVSSGLVRNENRLEFGAGQERVRTDDRIPLDVTVLWGASVRTNYRGAFQSGRGTDPTGDTEREGVSHNVSLTSSFTPPGNFGSRLDRPIQVAIRYSYTSQADCRVTVGGGGCVPFVDLLNRSFNLTVDSSIDQFEFGLQTSYVDRQSFIGQRSGSTQFQLGFFGQFQFTSGVFGLR